MTFSLLNTQVLAVPGLPTSESQETEMMMTSETDSGSEQVETVVEQTEESMTPEESNEDHQTSASNESSEMMESTEETDFGVNEDQEVDLSVVYDDQPTSLEDVKTIVQNYQNEFQAALAAADYEAVLNIAKPHWKDEVPSEFMPKGYKCMKVELGEDEEFMAPYYTFQVELVALVMTGTGTVANPFVLTEEADLVLLATNVNAGTDYSGVYFKLGNDITMSVASFTPIGNAAGKPFKGNFDGDGKSIKNFKSATTATNTVRGLFGYASDATIKNLTVELGGTVGSNNVYSNANGIIVSEGTDVTISNCHINGNNYELVGNTQNKGGTGGILGVTAGNTLIEDCTVTDLKMKVATNGGGIVGSTTTGLLTIKDCKVNNFSVAESTVSYGNNVGGILGGGTGGGALLGAGYADISGCYVENINIGTARYRYGGIVGVVANDVTITDCHVKGFTGKGHYDIGGLVGRIGNDVSGSGNVHIDACSAENINVTTTAGGYAGGLVGIMQSAYDVANMKSNSLKNSTADNITITTSANYAGGLVGCIDMIRNGDINVLNIYVENCHATNVTASGYSYISGMFGAIRSGNIKNVSVTDTTLNVRGADGGGAVGAAYAEAVIDGAAVRNVHITVSLTHTGGFAGVIYDNAIVSNSYATGGEVVKPGAGAGYIGGFAGGIYNKANVSNSYAQVDVQSKASSSGGFGGTIYDQAVVTNCYSNGAVQGTTYTGSFAGDCWNVAITLTNCYATGAVMNTSKVSAGAGFIGNGHSKAKITNCFFDTTMTGRPNASQTGSINNVTGLDTRTMIDIDTFSAWNIKENLFGKAGGVGTEADPWYMDDMITYPYFHYQYDGYTKEETNYFIGNTRYQSGQGLGQRRADFLVKEASLPLQTMSIGADRAYFPYSGVSQYALAPKAYTNVLGATQGSKLHSLGGMSQTDIIAFEGVPYAEKHSDRPEWDVTDRDTYTYVGDIVTYTIPVWHYGTESEFKEVVVTDDIHEDVTLLTDTITVNSGATYNESAAITITDDPSSKPYYEYNETTKVLKVFLPDMPKIDPNTGEVASYTITYKVKVEKEAASIFSDPTTYVGDIENKANLSGELHYTGEPDPIDYEYDFGDDNKDPVYDAYLFEFFKVDAGDSTKKLEGATFSVYKYVGAGTPTTAIDLTNPSADWALTTIRHKIPDTTILSDENGLVSYFQFVDYPAYYMIVEVAEPTGYLLTESQWLVSVNGNATDATVQTINPTDAIIINDMNLIDDGSGTTYYELGNRPNVGSITVKKYDENDDALAGAGFSIKRKDEVTNTWIAIKYDASTKTWSDITDGSEYKQDTVMDGAEAITVFENLTLGEYQISEVSSPDGYSTLLEPFIGTIPTNDENGNPVYDIVFEVRNNKALSMPTTGSIMTPNMIVLVGALLIALGFCVFIIRKNMTKKVVKSRVLRNDMK